MDMKNTGWPVSVLSQDLSRAGRLAALRTGPYGRCVYHCDNDVVDHQVVLMEFQGGVTASFTMSAFTLLKARETYVGGTLGMISGDGEVLEVTTFAREQRTLHDTRARGFDAGSGHGGGDFGLMKDFVRAVRKNDPGLLSSSVDVSLESHLMAFAAEKSRLTHRFVDIHI
jgi:predicted dehydrogenase